MTRTALAGVTIIVALGLGLFALQRLPGQLAPVRSSPHRVQRVRPEGPHASRVHSPVPSSQHPEQHGLWPTGWVLVIWVLAVCALLALPGVLALRRLRARSTRVYHRYELHLSTHDEAKPGDLEAMGEALTAAVRTAPVRRSRSGQPFVALELHYGPGEDGLEWTPCVLCRPEDVLAIDAALVSAYPDVRIGFVFDGEPQPIAGRLTTPGCVLRLHKERPFVYSLLAAPDRDGSPPLEAVAQAQVGLGAPSTVRLQLTPAPLWLGSVARRRLDREENQLVRRERWGLPEASGSSQLGLEEMRGARATQNRSMFWLECQVAASKEEDARRLAATLCAARGENRLRVRVMLVRAALYRGRFAAATPPLLPSPSLRSLVSSIEVARLLELPGARMKGVPVRRLTLPRLPAPPEIARAVDVRPPLPPAEEPVKRTVEEPTKTAVAS